MISCSKRRSRRKRKSYIYIAFMIMLFVLNDCHDILLTSYKWLGCKISSISTETKRANTQATHIQLSWVCMVWCMINVCVCVCVCVTDCVCARACMNMCVCMCTNSIHARFLLHQNHTVTFPLILWPWIKVNVNENGVYLHKLQSPW